MSTGLTSDTDHTIISLGHALNGYAYAKQALHASDDELHQILGERMRQIQESGKMALAAEENFAANFYLHRTFRHWGWLPEAKSAEWYTMLFLYLHLYRVPVPATYRSDSGYAGWTQRPKSAAEAAAVEIRLALRRE